MDSRAEFETKIGVKIPDKQKRVRPGALQALEDRGIVGVRPSTLYRIREGQTSGDKTKWRLDSAEVRDASKKNNFYTAICATGLRERVFNTAATRAHLFKSDGYVEQVATVLQLDSQVLERLIRAMRADMVLAQVRLPNSILAGQFNDVAERYLKAKMNVPPSLQPAGFGFMDESWDHRTMGSFYRNLYRYLGRRAIGTWTPYEMEVLSLFYRQQTGASNRLTPFDSLVLEAHKKGTIHKQVADEVRQLTGVAVNMEVLERHRNLMVYGSPAHLVK